MHVAAAPTALTDQRLHRVGLTAYWRAVDRAIARETAALEAAERAALAAARAALAEAEAEHAALVANVSAIDAAGSGAAVAPEAADTDSPDANGGVRDRVAAADAGWDVATLVAPAAGADAAPSRAGGADTDTEEVIVDHAEPHAEAKNAHPAEASLEAAAALDDRLAPVRAEREAAEAALAAVLRATADLRASLGGATRAGAAAATA